jgi:hypothetical protein
VYLVHMNLRVWAESRRPPSLDPKCPEYYHI